MERRLAVLFLGALALAGCATTPTPTASAPTTLPTVTAAPTSSPLAVDGGCGDTQVFAGPGPDASLGLADNPWAEASPASAGIIAYFWHRPPAIVLASGPEDSGDKVLWVVHGATGEPLTIVARQLDADNPVLRFSFPPAVGLADNYPSGIAVPTPGCWRFELTAGSTRATLDILVAPET